MVDSAAKTMDSNAPAAMGKYDPVARIGHGGMADVFLAVARGPQGFNKLSVVKRLRNPDDSSHVEMFLDEARLSARLSHPNIVNTYEVGESRGKFYIAMEYLEGQPLHALLAWLGSRGEGLHETLAAWIAVQALRGLHYAHELADYDGTPLSVVHRDVSPHNLFLTYGGEVKLLDFGIAKAAMNSTHTETGVLKGKIRYMAPEQIGERNVDRRADIFAFGIVFWEMLTRKPLYQGDSITVLTRISTVDAPSVRSVRPDIDPELEIIVARALRRDMNERYATADAMRADLERYLRGKQEGASDTVLARLMDQAFSETREGVRARIKAFLANLPDRKSGSGLSSPDLATSGELPSLFGDGSGSGQLPVIQPATATTTSGAVHSTSGTGTTDPNAIPIQYVSGRSPWAFVAGGVAVLAIVGIGLVSLRQKPPPVVAAELTPAAAVTTGQVHITTNPPGALIEWKGKPLDRTPADVTLDQGSQTVMISHDGFEKEEVTLNVTSGGTLDRSIDLRPKAAPIVPSATAVPDSPPRTASVPHRYGAPPRPATPTPGPATSPAATATPVVTATPTPTAAKPNIKMLDDNDQK